MPTLFLSPHNDDETLYGAYTLLREKPLVVVCYESKKQEIYGITKQMRQKETSNAMEILGCEWVQLLFPDNEDWEEELEKTLYDHLLSDPRSQKIEGESWDTIYAPADEGQNGNDQHRIIGQIADRLWPDKVVHYLTYTWPDGQSTDGTDVPYKTWDWTKPQEESWAELKYQAMECYKSQITLPSTAPHFNNHDMREYYEFS